MGQLSVMPFEIIENIAFFLAVEPILGPPSALVPLLLLHRRTYSFLAFCSNPHLYSRVFAAKFDTHFAVAHFRPDRLPATALAGELKRRCLYLKRIRSRLDCCDSGTRSMALSLKDPEHLRSILGTVYLMMLENSGKNETQLRNYADVECWIQNYWFENDGSSGARACLATDCWPKNDEMTAAAMWLLWFFFRPDAYIEDKDMRYHAERILKSYALGAHRYPLSHFVWSDYSPSEASLTSVSPFNMIAYGEQFRLTALPVGIPATLVYFSLYTKVRTITSVSPQVAVSNDCNHLRAQNNVGQQGLSLYNPDMHVSSLSILGSFDGVWEGIFKYGEFTEYTQLLRGGPPSTLLRTRAAQHRQTWKIREYGLLSSDQVQPLAIGDPMRGFFPANATVNETLGTLIVNEAGKTTQYTRSSDLSNFDEAPISDIVVVGEGHSAWGQFTLLGRRRPCDGLTVLLKEYHDGDRGSWLYRGFVVGDSFVGRWRDTISPVHLNGYEGCFIMGRRQ